MDQSTTDIFSEDTTESLARSVLEALCGTDGFRFSFEEILDQLALNRIPVIEDFFYKEDEQDSEKKPPYNWALDYIISERYRAKRRWLILLSCTLIISIKKLMHELKASISLIYGMHGSSISYIYSAVFGNSSNRIFSC